MKYLNHIIRVTKEISLSTVYLSPDRRYPDYSSLSQNLRSIYQNIQSLQKNSSGKFDVPGIAVFNKK